jgi:D-alanyl-D-alanine carboxypeptidase/D-alanyl-D-alanine-endopeptidase (penicillin-binding protein 4)
MALLTAPVIDSTRYAASLPILGRDGSLAHTATTPPARGHLRAKPGTTTVPGADGETLEPKAQNTARYVETRSGRRLAYTLTLDDVGAIENIKSDVADVFEEETEIANAIHQGVP